MQIQIKDNSPPSNDYFEVPGCEVIIASPHDKPITVARAAAILMRLAGRDPAAKIDLYVKVRQ